MNFNLYLGLMVGIGIGMNIGLWLGTYLVKKWTTPLLEDYKKSNKYWFDVYMKARKEAHENYLKYIREMIK